MDETYIVNGKDTATDHESSTTLSAKLQYSLGWSNISYSVNKGKKEIQILKNFTGLCEPGQLTAVMGPSGSGKTTLLDVLGDRLSSGQITGDVLVNGHARETDSFRKISSYVAQEDTLMGSFTTLETLRFSAKLSLPSSVSAKEREERVQQAIDDMGLRVCKDTIVGDMFRKGLSGGQKRRLSIAIELLARPSVLLLDEPTSGLDSASTENVMEHIVSLARGGRAIVCTIHQPSSTVYNMFDNVAYLVKGETVYYGPRDGVMPFFEGLGHEFPQYCNPSEYCLSLINMDFKGHGDVPALIKAYHDSPVFEGVRTKIETEKSTKTKPKDLSKLKPSAFAQFWVILIRSLKDNIRNPGIYWVRIVMYIMLCLMIGTMYLRTNDDITDSDLVPMLFYVMAFLVFMSVAVLPFFIENRAVFLRERINNSLNVVSYVIANFIAALPGIYLIALISSVLIVYLVGLNGLGYFMLNLFLALVIAESFMHVIAALVPHYIVGIAIGAGLYGMFMLAMGFLVPKDSIPVYWIWAYYGAFHTYSFQSFVYEEFKDRPEGSEGHAILVRLNMEEVDTDENMIIMAGYALALQVIFTIILYFFHTGRR